MENDQIKANPSDMVAFLLDENREKERQIAVLNSVAGKAIAENKQLKEKLAGNKKNTKKAGK